MRSTKQYRIGSGWACVINSGATRYDPIMLAVARAAQRRSILGEPILDEWIRALANEHKDSEGKITPTLSQARKRIMAAILNGYPDRIVETRVVDGQKELLTLPHINIDHYLAENERHLMIRLGYMRADTRIILMMGAYDVRVDRQSAQLPRFW